MTFEEALKQVEEMTDEEIKKLDSITLNPNNDDLNKVNVLALIALPINSETKESIHAPIGVIIPEGLFTELPEVGQTIILTDAAGKNFFAKILKVGVAFPKKELTAKDKRYLEAVKECERQLKQKMFSGEAQEDPEGYGAALEWIQAAREDIESGEAYRIKGAEEVINAMRKAGKRGNIKPMLDLLKKYKEADE